MIHLCPKCNQPMKYLGLWPKEYVLADTFICEACPKEGPPPGHYITVKIPNGTPVEYVQ